MFYVESKWEIYILNFRKVDFFLESVLYMQLYFHVYYNLFAFQDIRFVHVKPVKDDLFAIMSWSVFGLCLKRQIVKQIFK